MKVQHENILIENQTAVSEEPMKEYGFIATSMGDGLADIFRDFGVDYIIEGGQTMNPSTEDFMKAIDSINAENIIILPNNSNIIMAANQAKALSEKNIIVIPSKTVPQGFASLVSFNADASVEENEATMAEALTIVKSGQVTYAVRDTVMNDIEVKEGNFIGIGESKLLSAGESKEEITLKLIESLVDEDSAIITLFYGEDVTEEEANSFKEILEEKYEDIDIELYYGGQPIYYYLISVE
ncbi:dihydroxyacetone kinase family protein [[Clostridium] sordellii ATCC 9714]|nr:dihydroxyacetone kinase family protein [[Clostridium] sordellii ATCC 9714] [Paeniclostridium sordellii ATCC 9714]